MLARLTYEKGQELQILLRLLLLRVICFRGHDLLREELRYNQQHRHDQIGNCVAPTQWRLAVLEREQPRTCTLQCAHDLLFVGCFASGRSTCLMMTSRATLPHVRIFVAFDFCLPPFGLQGT